MPLGSKDSPANKAPDPPAKSDDTGTGPVEGVMSPHASSDAAFKDDPGQDLDPTKVVGTWAEQPDPNADRPAPQPVVPPGVNKAPADDEPGAPAIGGNPTK